MPGDWMVAAGFTAWFTAMAIRQFVPALRELALRYDVLGLLPGWALFGGREPFDFVFLFRVRHANGEIGEWQSIDQRPRHGVEMIWNPGLLRRHLLNEIGHSLDRRPQTASRRVEAHRALLAWVGGRARGAQAVQLMVRAERRFDETHLPRTVLLSEFEPIPDDDRDAIR